MKTRISLALLLTCASALAAKIELRFSTAAEREVWVLDEMPDRMPAAGRSFNTKTFPVETTSPSQIIVVHDPKTAIVAIKKAGDVTASWTVEDKEWRAAQVKVQAFTSGKPLDGGRVELHAPNFTKSMPVEDGEATFFAVPFGDVEVRVDYKGGGIPATAPQIFRIKKDSPPEERVLGVTVVAGEGTDPTEATKPEAPTVSEGPWYVNALLWLVGVAVAVALLILLMRFLKERSDVVEEKLKGLGVPVPGDLAPNQAADDNLPVAKPFEPEPVVPAGHCAYCGKPQADCICRLDAPRAVAHRADPEFVGVGVELTIPEGESVVGREGDLVIADATVSRQHAKIVRAGSSIKITDLGSANGTFVDGVRIEEEAALVPGSTVYFGSVKVKLEA